MTADDDRPAEDVPDPDSPDAHLVDEAADALAKGAPDPDKDELPELDLEALDIHVPDDAAALMPRDDAPPAPPEPEDEPEPDPAVADLTARLQAAERRADELAAVARRQSEMADELHAENRTLRAGEIREATAPLVRGLARLADDLDRLRDADPGNADLPYLGGQVDELLHDAGVLRVTPAPGDPFDPQAHQAAGSATTTDPAMDRTVADVRRPGLRRDDGRLLRPAEVVVHRHVPTEEETP